MKFKPTKPVPLPYKSAPLTTQDLILAQVRREEAYYPHLVYTFPEEVMRKELPTGKYSPVSRNWFQANVTRTLLALMP